MPNEPYVEQIMVADGDGDNPDVEEVKYERIPTGDNVTGVKGDSESTYRTGNVNITEDNIVGTDDNTDIADSDLIITKQNSDSKWYRKTFSKLVVYIKTKLGISAQGSTGKYLNEQGAWTTPPDTNTWPDNATYKSKMLDMCYPVGSIYTSTKNVSPATFLGGTWKSLNGYMLRSATSGVAFNNNAKDGGSDDAIVVSHSHTTPNHNHSFTGTAANYGSYGISANHYHGFTTNTGGEHWHFVASPSGHSWVANFGGGTRNSTFGFSPSAVNANVGYGDHALAAEPNSAGFNSNHAHDGNTGWVSSDHGHTTTVTPYGTIGNANPTTNSTGSSGTNANLPNYKNVYMWERTA